MRLSIFFSNAQKNLNSPKTKPITTKSTWYIGKIKISRIGVNHSPKSSLVMPNPKQNGLESQAEAEPVRAKTIKIIVSWKLDAIPPRCFSFSILLVYKIYKCSNIIVLEHNRQVFVCTCFEKKLPEFTILYIETLGFGV